jgi:hypothetical protein
MALLIILKQKSIMRSWKEQIALFKLQKTVQEAFDQQKISLLLFILGLESSNSIYPHESAKSRIIHLPKLNFY